MSCCGLSASPKANENGNGVNSTCSSNHPPQTTDTPVVSHFPARQHKLSDCLRNQLTHAARRFSSVFKMSLTKGSKKASYFSVVYSGSRFPIDGEASETPITFDTVLTQYPPNVYDGSRGVFTCPKSGSWMFQFSMRPDTGTVESFNVQLMKGDAPQVSLYVNTSGDAGTSSQSCILDVRMGEQVWLKMQHGALRSDRRCPSATFNGTLVRPIKKL